MAKKHQSISVLSSRTTATISVALVLFILGIVAMIGVAAHFIHSDLRQQLGFVVIVKDDAAEKQLTQLKQLWRTAPYVSSVKYSSAEDVLNRWERLIDDNDQPGNDITSLFGVNPFYPEFEVAVKPDYSHPDSLRAITTTLREMPAVSDVRINTDLVEAVNHSLRSLSLVMCIVAGALLLISFVLINNTVRLTVYSRRFIIHTMKLVGATAGFVRRPFIKDSLLQGLIASLIAIAALGALLFYLGSIEPQVPRLVPWPWAAVVGGALLITGLLICMVSSLLAANKYLRLGYNDMFK